jgi:transcriptional regulator with XRE-family HTH domain
MNSTISMQRIGTTIRNLRLQHHLSQSALAELLDLPAQSKISSWESGKTVPDMLEGQKLAEIFGVGMEEFFLKKDS